MKPHTALKYITPDEVAECWEGVIPTLYEALWECVPRYNTKYLANIEDIGPHDVIGLNCVADFWSSFSAVHKSILNRLAAEQMKKVEESL
jgi:hypothetical protein